MYKRGKEYPHLFCPFLLSLSSFQAVPSYPVIQICMFVCVWVRERECVWEREEKEEEKRGVSVWFPLKHSALNAVNIYEIVLSLNTRKFLFSVCLCPLVVSGQTKNKVPKSKQKKWIMWYDRQNAFTKGKACGFTQ